jgi:DMSO/TMAO reductase YedYZ molybdopterin-dependent catalytic subunit
MPIKPSFEIRGRIASGPLALDLEACRAFPEAAQVADAGSIVRGKEGRAVRLSAILARVRPTSEARFVNILSSDPAFAISVPLVEVLDRAVVIYASKDGPLEPKQGGPFRLLVPGHPDECVNVKALAAIELAEKPGRDTRPLDDAEHAKLHAKKKS